MRKNLSFIHKAIPHSRAGVNGAYSDVGEWEIDENDSLRSVEKPPKLFHVGKPNNIDFFSSAKTGKKIIYHQQLRTDIDVFGFAESLFEAHQYSVSQYFDVNVTSNLRFLVSWKLLLKYPLRIDSVRSSWKEA